MKRLFLLFCSSLLASSASVRADPVNVQGFEDMSCGAWVSSTSSPEARAQYLAWFRGFVTGVNFADSKHQISVAQMPSNDTVSLYVDKYCRENPLSIFPGAAFKLVRELRAP